MSKKTYPAWKATASHGRLTVSEQEQFEKYLHSLPKEVTVIVKPFKKYVPRSNQQNRYYHGVILPLLADHTGYSTNELHEILKRMFNGKTIAIKGTGYIVGQSTTELTTEEMEHYLGQIRDWASIELGCYLPNPNEVDWENYGQN